MTTLHRIGDHELHSPDYRLVCAWAEELGWDNEWVLDDLLDNKGARISKARFVSLWLGYPLKSMPLIEGLEVRELAFEEYHILTELDLTPVPNLEVLECKDNNLAELDLTPAPYFKTRKVKL